MIKSGFFVLPAAKWDTYETCLLGSRIDAFDIDIGNVVIPLKAKGADSVMMEGMRQMAWEGLDIVYRHLHGRLSNCQTPIHTLDSQAVHSPHPFPGSIHLHGI